jgi:DNA methylase
LSQLACTHAHETLIWASKGKRARHTFNYELINGPDPEAQVSSVWRIPTVSRDEKRMGYHPTQKPLRLVRRALLASTGEGALVFDPFAGSGTTGVAAKELGRFFVGAELEKEYAELAARRIEAAERARCSPRAIWPVRSQGSAAEPTALSKISSPRRTGADRLRSARVPELATVGSTRTPSGRGPVNALPSGRGPVDAPHRGLPCPRFPSPSPARRGRP